jgi:hypothetical protein
MTSRRQNNSRKNPFIRLFRMVYRSLKVIFRSKSKRLALAALYEQRELEARRAQEALYAEQEALDAQRDQEARRVLEDLALAQKLDDQAREHFLTVGELLRRVKWQTTTASATPAHDFSLN